MYLKHVLWHWWSLSVVLVKALREARQVVSDLKASSSSSVIPGKLQEATVVGPGKPNRTGAIKPQSVKVEESKAWADDVEALN